MNIIVFNNIDQTYSEANLENYEIITSGNSMLNDIIYYEFGDGDTHHYSFMTSFDSILNISKKPKCTFYRLKSKIKADKPDNKNIIKVNNKFVDLSDYELVTQGKRQKNDIVRYYDADVAEFVDASAGMNIYPDSYYAKIYRLKSKIKQNNSSLTWIQNSYRTGKPAYANLNDYYIVISGTRQLNDIVYDSTLKKHYYVTNLTENTTICSHEFIYRLKTKADKPDNENIIYVTNACYKINLNNYIHITNGKRKQDDVIYNINANTYKFAYYSIGSIIDDTDPNIKIYRLKSKINNNIISNTQYLDKLSAQLKALTKPDLAYVISNAIS